MITEVIINVLTSDSQIQTLLDAADASTCPVYTTHRFDDTVDKQINISYDLGETIPFDQSAETHDGIFRLYIMIKDTVSEPVELAHNIATRVLALLDLKGTTLDETETVYWVQKLDSDLTHYEGIKFYELEISFRFVGTF